MVKLTPCVMICWLARSLLRRAETIGDSCDISKATRAAKKDHDKLLAIAAAEELVKLKMLKSIARRDKQSQK